MFKDYLIIGLTILVFGISLLVSHYGLTLLKDGPLGETRPEVGYDVSAIDQGILILEGFDWLTPLLLVGLSLATFISAYYIHSHPVFAVSTLMLAFVWFLIVTPISNMWDLIITGASLGETANHFNLTSLAITNFPIISWILGLLSDAMFYGKKSPVGYNYG